MKANKLQIGRIRGKRINYPTVANLASYYGLEPNKNYSLGDIFDKAFSRGIDIRNKERQNSLPDVNLCIQQSRAIFNEQEKIKSFKLWQF